MRLDSNKEFHEIFVQTVDTIRNKYFVNVLLEANSQVLLVGHSGVGKTSIIEGILTQIQVSNNVNCFTINFSAGTTSNSVQDIIESHFERRIGNKYKPKNSKSKAICFIDDLNMPRKDTFGSQPPLELIRQWADYEFWYDRVKHARNAVQNLQILGAMGKPGGGRSEISKRLLSKFHVINYTIPSESNMKKIYETICQTKFQHFYDEIKTLSETLATATIQLYDKIAENFLPTPAKTHYVFNMRDISKVFQGIYQASKEFYEGKEQIIKLWGHEVMRVFHDRLISQ
jgi:dynein heavy chain